MKSITGVPPFEGPCAHDKPIYDPVVIPRLFAKFVGASGTVRIIAPFPAGETTELP